MAEMLSGAFILRRTVFLPRLKDIRRFAALRVQLASVLTFGGHPMTSDWLIGCHFLFVGARLKHSTIKRLRRSPCYPVFGTFFRVPTPKKPDDRQFKVGDKIRLNLHHGKIGRRRSRRGSGRRWN